MNGIDVLTADTVANYEAMRKRQERFEQPAPAEFVWSAGVERDKLFPQDCYRQAALYTINGIRLGEQHRLCHGETCLAFGGHAWVELPNGLVFDGVFQRFYSRDDYYGTVAMARCWYRYSADAVMILCRWCVAEWWLKIGLPMNFTSQPFEIDELQAALATVNIFAMSKAYLVRLAGQAGIPVKKRTKSDLIRLLMDHQQQKEVTADIEREVPNLVVAQ